MKIGIIGSGNIGGTLGKRWAAKGHQVMLSSRDPQGEKMQALAQEAGENASTGTAQAAIAFGDVIVLAVPFNQAGAILSEADDLHNKIVIDAMNRFDGQSAGMEVVRLAKNGRVVKAFNTVAWEVIAQPQYGVANASLLFAGDDADAKRVVAQLCAELGFDPLDVGGADNIPALESALMPLWRLLGPLLGREYGLRILKRGE